MSGEEMMKARTNIKRRKNTVLHFHKCTKCQHVSKSTEQRSWPLRVDTLGAFVMEDDVQQQQQHTQ